jgi:hypothetical protein
MGKSCKFKTLAVFCIKYLQIFFINKTESIHKGRHYLTSSLPLKKAIAKGY